MSPDEKKGLLFLKKNAYSLDLNRRVSFGENGGKNYIEQGKGSERVGMVISNDTTSPQVLVFGAKYSMYDSSSRLKEEVGESATAILLTDGRLVTETGTNGLIVKSTSTNRRVADFTSFLSDNPSTIYDIKFESSSLPARLAETTNYGQIVKAVYISPFRNPKITAELELREYRDDSVQSPQYLHVPVLEEGYNILLSNQNYLVMSINPKTELSVSMKIANMMSSAQDLYRQNTAAKEALAVAPMAAGESCGC